MIGTREEAQAWLAAALRDGWTDRDAERTDAMIRRLKHRSGWRAQVALGDQDDPYASSAITAWPAFSKEAYTGPVNPYAELRRVLPGGTMPQTRPDPAEYRGRVPSADERGIHEMTVPATFTVTEE